VSLQMTNLYGLLFSMGNYIAEKDVENSILEYLAYRGIFAWKNQSVGIWDAKKKIYRKSNNKYHVNGVSDILGVLPNGKVLCIEVKSPSNRDRPKHQREFISQVSSSGGVAFFADSVKVVDTRLKELGYKGRLLV